MAYDGLRKVHILYDDNDVNDDDDDDDKNDFCSMSARVSELANVCVCVCVHVKLVLCK